MPALKGVVYPLALVHKYIFFEEDGSEANICFTIGSVEGYTKMFRQWEAAAPEDREPFCSKTGQHDTYRGGAVFETYEDAKTASAEYGAQKGGYYGVYGLRTRWDDNAAVYGEDLRMFSVRWRRLINDCEVLELNPDFYGERA